MVFKICEVCGKIEEHDEVRYDVYGICEECNNIGEETDNIV
ncbi:hypothetical protein [uncultured Metabacillus sp.]|nr:hypothetical protein [uncultured Metabacillus sp.]